MIEENRKRLEEAQKRSRIEEQAMKMEQAKKMVELRKLIQQVTNAQPENFEELKRNLLKELPQDPNCPQGFQQHLQAEVDKALAQAQKRVDQINAQRQKEEAKKAEEERKRKERGELAQVLVQQLGVHVQRTEWGLEKMKKAAAAVEAGTELTVAQTKAALKALEVATKDTEASRKACSDFFSRHHTQMRDPAPAPVKTGGTPSEINQNLTQLLQRIGNFKKDIEATRTMSANNKAKLLARAKARDRTHELRAVFSKYDRDKDGVLLLEDVLAYSKAELKFTIPPTTLERIWETCVNEEGRGVDFDQFHMLRAGIGIARELERDAKRKVQREKRMERVKDVKAELQEQVKEIAKTVAQAEQSVEKAEKQVQTLTTKTKTMQVASMFTLANEIDELINAAQTSTSSAQTEINGIFEGVDETLKPDLESFFTTDVKKHELHLGRLTSRLNRAINLSARFRGNAKKKQAVDFEKLRPLALRVLRHSSQSKLQTNEDMFNSINVSGSGAINKEEFLAFFGPADQAYHETCAAKEQGVDGDSGKKDGSGEATQGEEQKPEDGAREATTGEGERGPQKPGKVSAGQSTLLSVADTETVFVGLCSEGTRQLQKKDFVQFLAVKMKVVNETAMTTALRIKGSSLVRRIEPAEPIEVLAGPLRESEIGIMRVRVRCAEDGLEGWATVVGNQGTIYLEEVEERPGGGA